MVSHFHNCGKITSILPWTTITLCCGCGLLFVGLLRLGVSNSQNAHPCSLILEYTTFLWFWFNLHIFTLLTFYSKYIKNILSVHIKFMANQIRVLSFNSRILIPDICVWLTFFLILSCDSNFAPDLHINEKLVAQKRYSRMLKVTKKLRTKSYH